MKIYIHQHICMCSLDNTIPFTYMNAIYELSTILFFIIIVKRLISQ